jgi:hypothetical protein
MKEGRHLRVEFLFFYNFLEQASHATAQSPPKETSGDVTKKQ